MSASLIYADDLAVSAAKLHSNIWNRMVEKSTGILLDYSDLDGKVDIPGPEDCEKGMPNAISWWTPIENGAFFNGLYLDALCAKWSIDKSPEAKTEIRKIVGGLILLQDVGKRKGFIARGVATDGKTHYPIGSDDQTFPWFYGLWKYLNSGIPDEAERKDIISRMDLVAKEVKKLHWQMPCEEPFTVRGGWFGVSFVASSRIVFVNRIMVELTGDEFWKTSLKDILAYRAKDGRTFLDAISGGDATMKPDQTWIHASSVAAVRELYRLEKDEQLKALYKAGLKSSGAAAAQHIGRYRNFKLNDAKYSGNWRCMVPLWKEQKTVQEAVDLALQQIKVWNSDSPAVARDKQFMMLPLFGAWIVLLSEDEELIKQNLPEIKNAFLHYDWSKIYYSAFFVGDNIYYELKVQNKL